MKIYISSFNPRVADISGNAAVARLLKTAAPQADLLLLPEAMAVLKKMGDNLDMQVLLGGELTCEAALEGLATGDDCLFETKNFSYSSVYGHPGGSE